MPLTWAWYAGTATTLVGKSWAQLEVHRADLLRCMLAISSSPLYRTSGTYPPVGPLHVVSCHSASFVLVLHC